MKLNPGKFNLANLIAGGAVVTVIVAIVSFFAGRALLSKLTLNNELLSKKRLAQQQLSANLEAINQLRSEYDALGPRRTLISDSLPTTANFPAIVSMMEKIASNAGVSLLSVTPSPTPTGTQPTSGSNLPTAYEYSATIRGGYDSYKSFLENVEKSVRPLSITVMKISGESNTLSVEMTIKTYFQPEFDTNLKTIPLRPTSQGAGLTAPTINTNAVNPASGVAQ